MEQWGKIWQINCPIWPIYKWTSRTLCADGEGCTSCNELNEGITTMWPEHVPLTILWGSTHDNGTISSKTFSETWFMHKNEPSSARLCAFEDHSEPTIANGLHIWNFQSRAISVFFLWQSKIVQVNSTHCCYPPGTNALHDTVPGKNLKDTSSRLGILYFKINQWGLKM